MYEGWTRLFAYSESQRRESASLYMKWNVVRNKKWGVQEKGRIRVREKLEEVVQGDEEKKAKSHVKVYIQNGGPVSSE